jgi:hypothetical protein
MAKKDTDHVRIANTNDGGYRMFCLHCGQYYTPALPISMDMMLANMKVFGKEHNKCKPGERIFTEREIMQKALAAGMVK